MEENLKKTIIGKKDKERTYNFRETCFGIVVKNDTLYCTEKGNEISLIGGGVENGETHIECLKREFLEEAGCIIKSAEPLCIIDCYWITRDKKYMESLSNIYIVSIIDEIVMPTEVDCRLKCINLEKAMDLLPLPYHKKALEVYFSYMKEIIL